MQEELRIRASAEAIPRRMSAIHGRKMRIVLISGVACICVGLGALAVIVQKPATFYKALDFLGIPRTNLSQLFLGSSGPSKALVHSNGNGSITLSPAASDNASSSWPTNVTSSPQDRDGTNRRREVSLLAPSDNGNQKTRINDSMEPVAVQLNITAFSPSPNRRAPVVPLHAKPAAMESIYNISVTVTTLSRNVSITVESGTPRNMSEGSNVTSRMAYVVSGTPRNMSEGSNVTSRMAYVVSGTPRNMSEGSNVTSRMAYVVSGTPRNMSEGSNVTSRMAYVVSGTPRNMSEGSIVASRMAYVVLSALSDMSEGSNVTSRMAYVVSGAPSDMSVGSNVTSRMAFLVVGNDSSEERGQRPQPLLVEADTGTPATKESEPDTPPSAPPASPRSELSKLWYYIGKPENTTSDDAEDDVLVVGDDTEKP
ncbi:hypothetical protein V5799_003182 [Amblyomma americanum]|uniref:Uncharacterized protein n=1 Tax=Amblyomma americanum TaxID=6943 RepID=A0AAQ4D9Q6_AMBAM